MKWLHVACLGLATASGCSQKISVPLADSSVPATEQRSSEGKPACDEAGDKWFKDNYPLPDERSKGATGKATYTVHYSAALQHCFLESVAVAHIGKEANTPVAGDSEIHSLIDLDSGKQVGEFVIVSTSSAPLMCQVGDAKCGTSKDWDRLTARYMKD